MIVPDSDHDTLSSLLVFLVWGVHDAAHHCLYLFLSSHLCDPGIMADTVKRPLLPSPLGHGESSCTDENHKIVLDANWRFVLLLLILSYSFSFLVDNILLHCLCYQLVLFPYTSIIYLLLYCRWVHNNGYTNSTMEI